MIGLLRDIWETGQLVLLLSLGALILFALHRFFGWRGVVAGALAILGLTLYRKGRTDGHTHTIEKERADAGRAERTAETERVRSDLRNADPDELMRDDGFKRD